MPQEKSKTRIADWMDIDREVQIYHKNNPEPFEGNVSKIVGDEGDRIVVLRKDDIGPDYEVGYTYIKESEISSFTIKIKKEEVEEPEEEE